MYCTKELRIMRLKDRLNILRGRPLKKGNGNVQKKILRQLKKFGVEI